MLKKHAKRRNTKCEEKKDLVKIKKREKVRWS
jgi:hypothetical protein